MNTRKKLSSALCLAWLLISVVFSSCENNEKKTQSGEPIQQSDSGYTCPMHPEVIRDKGGQCPKCGMNLEPFAKKPMVQIISPNKQVLSRQATLKPQLASRTKPLKAQGFIALDPSRNHSTSARFEGRIEKLFIKFDGQFVKKGEKILELYSPELRTIQEEHLFLVKLGKEKSLLNKSREKLRLLGITENQIGQLEKAGKVAFTISVFNPSDGFVFFNTGSSENSAAAENQPKMQGMGVEQNSKNKKAVGSSPTQIREGMYVTKGQTLFNINDLQQIWALIFIPNGQLGQITENQMVEIIPENNPSGILQGRISLVEKIYEEDNQRFARVRVVLPNPGNVLKINSLVTAMITMQKSQDLWVPTSAVYRAGLSAYVWVKDETKKKGNSVFKLRKVMPGATTNGMTIIKSGISAEEEIAREAGLMTDSETFLNTN